MDILIIFCIVISITNISYQMPTQDSESLETLLKFISLKEGEEIGHPLYFDFDEIYYDQNEVDDSSEEYHNILVRKKQKSSASKNKKKGAGRGMHGRGMGQPESEPESKPEPKNKKKKGDFGRGMSRVILPQINKPDIILEPPPLVENIKVRKRKQKVQNKELGMDEEILPEMTLTTTTTEIVNILNETTPGTITEERPLVENIKIRKRKPPPKIQKQENSVDFNDKDTLTNPEQSLNLIDNTTVRELPPVVEIPKSNYQNAKVRKRKPKP